MRVAIFTTILLTTFSPVLAQERQWTLDVSEREAFLVFGVPDTDDVGFSFWCDIGKSKISIFAPVAHTALKQNKRLHIDLAIDDEKFNIIAKASSTPGTQDSSVEALVAIDGTVMKAVGQAQTITVKVANHTASYPLVDADIKGLLRVCSGELSN